MTALIVQSLHNELTSGFGYDPERLAVAQVDLESRRYTVERAGAFYRDFLTKIQSDQRISAASLVRFLPFDDTAAAWPIYLADQPATQHPRQIRINRVGVDFFRTVGLPIVAGQGFQNADFTKPGAIVSESFARKFWPNRSAIGQRISLVAATGPFLEVVGLAKDAKWGDLQERPKPYVYLPNTIVAKLDPLSDFATGMQFVVRTKGDPRHVLADLRRTAAAMDPSLSVPRLTTLADYIAKAAEGERDRALLVAALAVICVALCAIGVYAVLSQALAGRAQELAIRLALGAPPSHLRRTVVLRGVGQILIGAFLGLVLTLALGRLVQSQLYGIGARNVLTLGISTCVILGMGISICLVQGSKVVRVASSALMTEIRRQ
jgi:cell division protein FtsX